MFTLHDNARKALEAAETTEGEMEVAAIRTLLALKWESDSLSKRIDAALTREAANA